MDEEKEAGEIEDSGDDDCSAKPSTSNVPGGVFDRMMLESRSFGEVQVNAFDNDSRSTPSSYRSNTPHGMSSSENSVDSEEESMLWQCKRKKYHEKKRREKLHGSHVPEQTKPDSLGDGRARRVNNLWGNVLVEQSLSSTLSSVDMDLPADCYGDRNVETYNYKRALDDTRPRVVYPDSDDEPLEPTEPTCNELTSVESFGTVAARKRRRNAKLRVGPRSYDKDVSREHHSVTAEDADEKVIEVMAAFLKETRTDLLEKIVKRAGKERALELFYQTEDLEAAGGMMTMDGERRRTPGGVYIQLFKMHPDTTKADIRAVFFEQQRQEKKESRKRRRHYDWIDRHIQDHITSIKHTSDMEEDPPNKCTLLDTDGVVDGGQHNTDNVINNKDTARNKIDDRESSDEHDLWNLNDESSIILE